MKDSLKEPILSQENLKLSVSDSDSKFIDKSNGKISYSSETQQKSELSFFSFHSKCEEHNKIEHVFLVKYCWYKIFLFVLCNILTVGIINLVMAWSKNLFMLFLYSYVHDIEEAQYVKVIDTQKEISFIQLVKSKNFQSNTQSNNNKDIVIPTQVYKKLSIDSVKSKLLTNRVNMNICASQLTNGEYSCFEFKLFKYVVHNESRTVYPLVFEIRSPTNDYIQQQEVAEAEKNPRITNNMNRNMKQDNEHKALSRVTRRIFHSHFSQGLSTRDFTLLQFLFGKCDLIIELNSVLKLLWTELIDPFYLFQIASCILWYNNEYALYASVILVTTIISLTYSVYETRANLQNIQKMAKYSTKVKVVRDGTVKELSSEELVSGDLIMVGEADSILPCDALLLSGSVILNEALLTGESTPIVKDSLPNDESLFDIENDKRHMMYNGTRIIQRRGNCLAVVYQTAFNTEKGSLIRSILYPKPTKSKFRSESIRYVLIMGIIGILGYFASLFFLIGEISTKEVILKFLDLITTVVPPALPACLGIGISFAVNRLKAKQINCIDRAKVNLAGMTNLVCFDKTGTLTEDHLDIIGFKRNTLTGKGFEFETLNNDFFDLSKSVYESAVNIFNQNNDNEDMLSDVNTNSEAMIVKGKYNKGMNQLQEEEQVEYNLNDKQRDSQVNKKQRKQSSLYQFNKNNETTGDRGTVNQIDSNYPERNDYSRKENNSHINSNNNKSKEKPEVKRFKDKSMIMDRMFVECMASCHAITRIEGKLIGDPIDVGMFEKSTWKFIQTEEEVSDDASRGKRFEQDTSEKNTQSKGKSNNDVPESVLNLFKPNDQVVSSNVMPFQEKPLSEKLVDLENNIPSDASNSDTDNEEDRILQTHYELGIIRKFNFSSKLQRMTVIAKNLNENEVCLVYSKGSPEKISELCKQETIPDNFKGVLKYYASKGYRVMAMSGKAMKLDYMRAQAIDRSLLEKNMVFLGLIVIQNKLKEKTIPTLELLEECRLKMIMATGDNLLTAIAVARESGMISKDCKVFQCIANKTEEDASKNSSQSLSNRETNSNVNQRDIKKKEMYHLEWESYVEITEEHHLGEIDRDNLLEKVNVSINNLIDNNSTRNQGQRKRKDSGRSINEDKVLQFYKYLEIEDSSDQFIQSTKLNEVDHLLSIANTTNTANKATNNSTNISNNNKQTGNKGADHYDSVISVNINLDHIPFEYKRSSEDQIVVVTNGSTFEMLYNLSQKYRQTKDPNFKIYYDTLRIILKKGYVFARMSPDQKTLLVESFCEENFTVCMCGDGANDCGALKAASVGISLSLEEASIAAPFTSRIPDISCLRELFLESKASIVTSFQCFKYNMFFSMIQFISVVLLNIYSSYLTDNQFLATDIFVIFPLAILLARTESANHLNRHYPVNSLFSVSIIISLILQTIVFFGFQFGIRIILIHYKDFKSGTCGFHGSNDAPNVCTENTAIFLVSQFQYITASVVVCMVKYFKKQFYTNFIMLIYMLILFCYFVYATLRRDWSTDHLINIVEFDNTEFNYIILIAVLVNIIVCFIIEFIIVGSIEAYWKEKKIQKMTEKVRRMEEEEFLDSTDCTDGDEKEKVTLEEIHKVLKSKNFD